MSWTITAKNTTTLVAGVLEAIVGYLLNEDGSFLLQETSGKIVLERDWSTEDKPTSSFNATAKPISGFNPVAKPISGFSVVAKGAAVA